MPYHSRGYGNAPMGSKKKLTDAQMKKLEEHSKKHKGGMNSKHMKNMIKSMKEGKTFTQAHNEAMKKDKMGMKKDDKIGVATLGGKKIEFMKGALHRQLKVPDDYKFTKSELERLEKINNGKQFDYKGRSFKMTDKLKKRITFGLNLMKRK